MDIAQLLFQLRITGDKKVIAGTRNVGKSIKNLEGVAVNAGTGIGKSLGGAFGDVTYSTANLQKELKKSGASIGNSVKGVSKDVAKTKIQPPEWVGFDKQETALTNFSNKTSKALSMTQEEFKAMPKTLPMEGINNALDSTRQTSTDVASGLKLTGGEFQAMQEPVTGLGRTLSMSQEAWVAQNKGVAGFKGAGAQAGNAVRHLTHGLRGFRMEFLGIMFFGMSMQRMFMGWLRPAGEAYGVFDLFGTMLLVMFIPIMNLLAPILMDIMFWFMDLPEPLKILIGAFAVVGAVVGTVLFVLGTLGLGIGSLILTVGLCADIITKFGTVLGVIFSGVAIIVGAVLVAIVLFALAWKYNFGNIREHTEALFGVVKHIFDNIIGVFRGLWEIFEGIITVDGEKIKTGFIRIWNSIQNVLIDVFCKIPNIIMDFLWDAFASIGKWGSDVIDLIWDSIVGGFNKAVGFVKKIGGVVAEKLGFGKTETVNDFILSKGRLIKTHPRDVITGTKDGQGMGSSINLTVSPTINITGGESMDEYALANRIGEIVSEQLTGLSLR